VTGVRTDNGTIHARVVVGADGRRSAVARTVGAQEYDVTQPGRMAEPALNVAVPQPGNTCPGYLTSDTAVFEI
jgi:2-polyprenyl-6-methoxyphenol hydroxylase-like FAD-dependent oxidoreductase